MSNGIYVQLFLQYIYMNMLLQHYPFQKGNNSSVQKWWICSFWCCIAGVLHGFEPISNHQFSFKTSLQKNGVPKDDRCACPTVVFFVVVAGFLAWKKADLLQLLRGVGLSPHPPGANPPRITAGSTGWIYPPTMKGPPPGWLHFFSRESH